MEEMKIFIPDFPEVSAEDWKEKLKKDLKGISFDDLISTDRNGIDIHPFYTDSTSSLQAVPRFRDWFIMERLYINSNTNARALFLLNNGISGLEFIIENGHTDWKQLLNGIDLKYIYLKISFSQSQYFNEALHCFSEYLNEYYSGEMQSLNVSVDCVELPYSFYNDTLYINGEIYNNAGCNAVFELGSCLAQLNEALHDAESKLQLTQIYRIYIDITIDTQFFEQIAKLRSIRILANNIIDGYKIDAELFIIAKTSSIFLSTADAPNNILRNAIAGMASAIGGADAIWIQPFSLSESEEFVSRVGRNQQLLFKEESYMHLVGDKGNGSYFIENYTNKICECSWNIFQKIENKGGWDSCMTSNYIQNEIEEQSNRLIEDYKNKKRLLIGVNQYQPKEQQRSVPFPKIERFGISSINIEALLKNSVNDQ